MKIRRLATASDVIDELGGTVEFAKLIGEGREKQHVSNYRATGRLPHDCYLVVLAALKKRDCIAPASIWGIREPARAAS